MTTRQQEPNPPVTENQADLNSWIPYGKHSVDQNDIDSVVEVLQSSFLTTGPKVADFESAMMEYTGASQAVAVNSGTAALHAMLNGFGIGPGDQVVVPSITFAATATAVLHAGADPVFADVNPATILMGPEQVEKVLTEKTRAVIAVDFAGQACDYEGIRDLLSSRDIHLFADACHAIGGRRHDQAVGNLADATTFSFHPVKHITTGEGGMILTHSAEAADRMRRFRNHGITVTHAEREKKGNWFYEIHDIGMNYRLSDFQCALGMSQLKRLDDWVAKRRQVASWYDQLLSEIPGVEPLAHLPGNQHAYHLYVVRIDAELAGFDRQQAFARMRDNQIGVNVHYIPVHLHPYFQNNRGTGPGQCPNAESYYEQALTLPVFPSITKDQVRKVVDVLSGT